MEAPKRIRIDDTQDTGRGYWFLTNEPNIDTAPFPIYIRSDLVDKLIGYAVHDDGCVIHRFGNAMIVDGKCTCGLSDLIKEIRG